VTRARVGLWAVLVLGAAGCHPFTLADAERSSETALARQVLEALERGDADAVMSRLSPAQQLSETRDEVRAIVARLPSGPPAQLRLYGWNVSRTDTESTSSETARLSFEATYPQGSYLVEMAFQGPRLALDMTGLNVTRLPAPLAVMNAFTFAGRSAVHYLFLLLMVAAGAATAIALIRWNRIRRTLRHPWWWLAGLLALPISLTLNWTTGGITCRAIKFEIGTFIGVGRGGDGGPWMLTFAIPIGAVVFLVLKRKRTVPASSAGDGPPASVPEV
jgi:hypothetical protein